MQFKSFALFALASLQVSNAATIFARDSGHGHIDNNPTINAAQTATDQFTYELYFNKGKLPLDRPGTLELDVELLGDSNTADYFDKSSGVHASDNLKQTSEHLDLNNGHAKGTWEYNGDGNPATLTYYGGSIKGGDVAGTKFALNGKFTDSKNDVIEYNNVTTDL